MWHKVLRSVKLEHMSFVEEAYKDLVVNGSAELIPKDEKYPEHPTYFVSCVSLGQINDQVQNCLQRFAS